MDIMAYTDKGFKVISVDTKPTETKCTITDKYTSKTYTVLDWFVLIDSCYASDSKGKIVSVGSHK